MEAAPPLPLPLAAAAVRWLWLRHLGCQEGRGTARGHPQELDNREQVETQCSVYVLSVGSGGQRERRWKDTKDWTTERVAHISNANT